jgi:hypothetical protein
MTPATHAQPISLSTLHRRGPRPLEPRLRERAIEIEVGIGILLSWGWLAGMKGWLGEGWVDVCLGGCLFVCLFVCLYTEGLYVRH